MKIKEGYMLRKVGKEHIAVAVGKNAEEFNGMIRMNGAGQFIWNELKRDISEDELVQKMIEHYEGLDELTARTDLKVFLDSIMFAIEA